MPFDTIAANAPSIFVSSASELEDAYNTLSSANGGTIYVTDDFPNKDIIDLSRGGDEPVHITSANPENPTEVGRILLNQVENVKFSNFVVDSTGLTFPEWQGDVDVDNSTNVTFDEITFKSDGSQFYDPSSSSTIDGGRGFMVTGSEDITLSNSTLSQYFQAVTIVDNVGVTLEGNNIFAIQGDGIKMSQVQDVLVKDNYLHDFATSPNTSFHSDFIQLLSGGLTEFISSDVTITGNVLDTGNGSSVQGIWLRNEHHDATGQDSDLYKNITVTDNLIYTASANGIGLGATDGAIIANNTLLWNTDAGTLQSGNQVTSFVPRIRINDESQNVQLIDNVTPHMVPTTADVTESGTVFIEYDDTSDPNYVGNHYVDVANGGDISWEDWQLRADSPLVGTGAAVTQPGGNGTPFDAADLTSDVQVPTPPVVEPEPQAPEAPAEADSFSNDAEVVVEEPAPAPTPEPAPSVTPPVTSFSDQPAIQIDSDTLLSFDFSNAVIADTSEYESILQSASARNLVNEGGNTAYQIGNGQMVRFDADNAQLHELDSFGFEMDIRLLDPTDYGRFLHFPRAFEAVVEKDGTVTFSLTTDDGNFEVNSGEPVFDDLQSHHFAVGYDDAAGKLSLVIDGVVADTTDASGTTAEGLHHGLTVGTIWGEPVDAVVDNIFLGNNPADAGVDLSLETGELSDPDAGLVDEADSDGGFATGSAGVPTPDVPINPADALFAMEFEGNALADLSSYDSVLKSGDASNIVANDTGHGYLISDDSRISLHRANDQIHELESFGLRIDIQLLDDTETGRFLHFPRAFEAKVEDDRSITFSLTTDEGTFKVNSGETTLDDLQLHSFAVGYDSENGRLTMEIDDQVVDSVAASGSTGEALHHGLTVGSAWGDSVTAIVDNVWFGESPEAVGVDTTAGVLYALQSTAVDVPADADQLTNDIDIEDDLDLIV